MGKHVHGDVIAAAIENKLVQWYSTDHQDWVTKEGHDAIQCWHWSLNQKYRIKPEPVYPKSKMEYYELKEAYYVFGSKNCELSSWHSDAAKNLADAAIRRAIEDGDVILPNKD